MKKEKKILFLFLIGLMLVGCSKNDRLEEEQPKKDDKVIEKLFSFKDVGKKADYQGLSNMGIDYTFPNFNSSWSGKDLGDDCKVYNNLQDTSKVFVVRNVDVKDVASEDFLKKLNGKDIRGYLEQQIAEHIGKTEESEGELNYVDQMKFYDVSGKTELNDVNYIYKATYFQSRLFQPSVSRKYVPTAFFILYEDGEDTESVLGMVETFKNNLIYQN